ncbi:TPA: hypothetical protein ACP32N_005034 [Pseudomonas aeruginosa]
MNQKYQDPRDGEVVWSTNDEDWRDQTLPEVLKANKHLQVGSIVFRGVKAYPDPASYIPDVDDLLMHMQEEAEGSDCGECADGYPDVSEEAKAELAQLLEPLQAWARRHCAPGFYLIENVQQVALSLEHLDQAQEPQT